MEEERATDAQSTAKSLGTSEQTGSTIVTLAHGTPIPIRPIRPDDDEALRRFHSGLSDRSVFNRFFAPLPELSPERAHYFTHVDGLQRFALVALDPEEPTTIVAVVRFDRDPGTDRAEYAAVVTDAWQGRGLGLAMTLVLIEAARARGIHTLYALVLPENIRMLNLLRDLGLPERIRFIDGVERVEINLSPSERADEAAAAGGSVS